MSLAQAERPANTIEDSLRAGHDAAYRAICTIDAIWEELTGNGETAPCETSRCGIIYSADELASRINLIGSRLEDIRFRIATPKVVSMTAGAQNAASGYVTGGKNAY